MEQHQNRAKNNQVSTYTSRGLVSDMWSKTTTVPDGYYNVCELNEDVFQPLGAELNLQTPTGRLQLSTKKHLALNSGLAKLLGFSRDRFFEPGETYIAGEPHRLARVGRLDRARVGRPQTS